MFTRALTGLGISMALLGGNAAGQEIGLPSVDLPEIALPGNDQVLWPDTAWASGTVPTESDAGVQALIDDAMSRDFADEMGETRELVIIHKGRLVADAYRDGYTEDTKLVSWSMAKSVTQALVGRAVMEGRIEDIDVPMPGPWEAGDPRAAITWRQWMTMTDGLEYYEVGEADLAKNDVVQMMFGSGRYDMIGYVKTLPQIHEAGTHWNYSTAAFHTISRAVQDALLPSPGLKIDPGPPGTYCYDVQMERSATFGETLKAELEDERARARGETPPKRDPISSEQRAARQMYRGELLKCGQAQWLDSALFSPLGMDAQPEFDAAGTFLGGSLVYASARDFARFGYLYLRDGKWDGERLLPEGWVDFATTAHEGTDTNVYGAGWWITPDEGETPTHAQSAKSAPYDAFHAGGNEGQTIWVVPSKDLVIVRLGLMTNAPENWAALYEWNQKVARAFPDVE